MNRRWSKTQAAAKKIDEFQFRTYRGFTLHLWFVIHHSSFVFWLLKQFCGRSAKAHPGFSPA
jgi:hypothetical protein